MRRSAETCQVIEAEDPPYSYYDERWLFLQDVFAENDSYILEGLTATPQRYDNDQVMVLINGKGAGVHDNGIKCKESLSVIDVEPGKTYRFRVVGATAISFNTFGIEGHNDFELIEADGYAMFSPLFFSLYPLRKLNV